MRTHASNAWPVLLKDVRYMSAAGGVWYSCKTFRGVFDRRAAAIKRHAGLWWNILGEIFAHRIAKRVTRSVICESIPSLLRIA